MFDSFPSKMKFYFPLLRRITRTNSSLSSNETIGFVIVYFLFASTNRRTCSIISYIAMQFFPHFPSSLDGKKPRPKDKKLFRNILHLPRLNFPFSVFLVVRGFFFSLKYKLNYIAKSSSHWTKTPS